MSAQPNPKSDWKLLLTIGGLVVTGAVVIAVLAGLDAGREPASVRDTAVPRVAAAGEVSPAHVSERTVARAGPGEESMAARPASLEKLPGSTIGIEALAEAGVSLQGETDNPYPVDPDADFAAVGHAAFAAREFDKAVAYWRADVEARPERAYSHYMLGLSLWKAGRPDEAAPELRRAGVLNGESIRTFVNLSRVLNETGEFEEALSAAETALSIDSDNPQAIYLRARSLRNLGRDEEAISALERALSIDAEYGHARNLLGLIRIAQGRYVDAASELRLAARFEPEIAYIHGNLGRALELSGQPDAAAEAFRAALALDPDQPALAVSLARVESAIVPPAPESAAEAVATVDSAVENELEPVTDGVDGLR